MITSFAHWYILEVPVAIKKVWANYLWFFPRYFFLGRMARELFAPWKGLVFMREKRSFEIGDAFSAAFGNVFSSTIGAVIRLFCLAIGLAVEVLALVCGITVYVAWLLFIPAIFYCFINGILMLV
ncbi:MAG: hypothetical protein MUD10_05640 [Candidatus Pacebacteria bacterium]|jgi:hypothetical protein|nr:hypothetical protein [Candidatus Paceibacterota bacterium]